MDYKSSGVDREQGDRFVSNLGPVIRSTFRSEIESDIGDFGAFFRAPTHLKDPLWVATTDGVGTKLLLAEEAGSHRGVGQDVVAMCVNDLLCCRAEPIVFLDYLATGKIEGRALSELVEGIATACKESNCSLVGGETAEMPGYYPAGRYDVAGFSIGVLERSTRFNPKQVVAGDLIFGFPSSGFHSNGYSLVRKVIETQKWSLSQTLEGKVLGEALLAPTELYVKRVLKLFSKVEIKAAAHITGGGLIENLPRGVDEKAVSLSIDRSKIPTSAIMRRFVEAAKLAEKEAYSTWNMGIGFCVIAPSSSQAAIIEAGAIEIGQVIAKQNEAVILR